MERNIGSAVVYYNNPGTNMCTRLHACTLTLQGLIHYTTVQYTAHTNARKYPSSQQVRLQVNVGGVVFGKCFITLSFCRIFTKFCYSLLVLNLKYMNYLSGKNFQFKNTFHTPEMWSKTLKLNAQEPCKTNLEKNHI